MQLLPCNQPSGTLEPAPRTSLRADTPDERWEGFWCDADERYYTRCTRRDGAEAWFRLVDEMPLDDAAAGVRIFKFPSSSAAKITVTGMRLLGNSGKRPILVGTARRAPRTRTVGAGGGR